jgi:hypothetical protein
MARAIRVITDVDDVEVVEQSVDQGRGHDFVADDFSALLEALWM